MQLSHQQTAISPIEGAGRRILENGKRLVQRQVAVIAGTEFDGVDAADMGKDGNCAAQAAFQAPMKQLDVLMVSFVTKVSNGLYVS